MIIDPMFDKAAKIKMFKTANNFYKNNANSVQDLDY